MACAVRILNEGQIVCSCPLSFGFLLCNSTRAVGALAGFLVAFASINMVMHLNMGFFCLLLVY